MKKIIAAAAGLMMVGVMASSASAVENKFGGYWRMRGLSQINFDGTDSGTYSRADSRTRLYYTAIFNENFKFVNKFEFDAIYGEDKSGYGDVGADGIKVEIKNTYADFKLGASHWKIGTQGFAVSRGLLVDTDASGIFAAFDAGPASIPVFWYAVDDKNIKGNERDVYGIAPTFSAGEGVSVTPIFVYDNNQSNWDNYYLGVDVDAKMDAASFWGTFYYNFGTIDPTDTDIDLDINAWLFAVGGSTGPVHGQFFYASGDDDGRDDKVESFVSAPGQSYYWAEIMGYGTFDNQVSNGSPGDAISNVWAGNLGFKVKPMDQLTLVGDIWYASLAESVLDDKELGWELDLKATYALMDNLKLDVVAAYLFAGDATGDKDPVEVGARLSLSF